MRTNSKKKETNKLLTPNVHSVHKSFSIKTDELFRQALDALVKQYNFSNRQEVVYEAVFRLAEAAFDPEKPLPSRARVDAFRDGETMLKVEAEQSLVNAYHRSHQR